MVPLIPVDKANHVIYGMLAFIVAAGLACVFGWPQYRTVVGIAGCLAAGATKEVSDYLAARKAAAAGATPTTTPDPADLGFTAAGGLLAIAAAAVGAY